MQWEVITEAEVAFICRVPCFSDLTDLDNLLESFEKYRVMGVRPGNCDLIGWRGTERAWVLVVMILLIGRCNHRSSLFTMGRVNTSGCRAGLVLRSPVPPSPPGVLCSLLSAASQCWVFMGGGAGAGAGEKERK